MCLDIHFVQWDIIGNDVPAYIIHLWNWWHKIELSPLPPCTIWKPSSRMCLSVPELELLNHLTTSYLPTRTNQTVYTVSLNTRVVFVTHLLCRTPLDQMLRKYKLKNRYLNVSCCSNQIDAMCKRAPVNEHADNGYIDDDSYGDYLMIRRRH